MILGLGRRSHDDKGLYGSPATSMILRVKPISGDTWDVILTRGTLDADLEDSEERSGGPSATAKNRGSKEHISGTRPSFAVDC